MGAQIGDRRRELSNSYLSARLDVGQTLAVKQRKSAPHEFVLDAIAVRPRMAFACFMTSFPGPGSYRASELITEDPLTFTEGKLPAADSFGLDG